MIETGKRLAAQTVHYGHRVDFYLADHDQTGRRMYAKEIAFEAPEHVGMLLPPSFSLHVDAAQELFEMLWAQGFRSPHDKGGAKELDAARREHIADLRRAAKLDREK